MESKVEKKLTGNGPNEVALKRRDLIKLGLAGAVLSCLDSGCQNDTSSNPPGQPEQLYELTQGHTLYDDFDGNGNLQTYNNQNLAEAGKLSSQIWDTLSAGYEVVQDPAAQGLLTVVNEEGQRVEYGLLEEPVQEVATYLAESPRPVTAFEREVLERLLNERGRIIVADVEGRDLEGQAKVLQYVLTNRRELFNERGRKLVETISRKSSLTLDRGGFQELTKLGYEETELLVLGQLVAEQQSFKLTRNSFLSQALGAIGRRKEPREVKYVFDADGRLLQAVPHIPGEPYHASRQLLWVGARNGRFDTGRGPLTVEKGKVYGSAQLKSMGGSGWVLKLTSSQVGFMGLILTSRRDLEFTDYKTLSADMMIPSTSTGPDYFAALDYHTTIPEQPPGVSWMTHLGIRKYSTGEVHLFAQCLNRNTGYRTYLDLGQARMDTWYNLRMDIVTKKDDPRLGDTELRIDYYVDGELRGSEVPEDSELLLDPQRTGAGPNRIIRITAETPEGESTAYFDNVKAVYSNRIK